MSDLLRAFALVVAVAVSHVVNIATHHGGLVRPAHPSGLSTKEQVLDRTRLLHTEAAIAASERPRPRPVRVELPRTGGYTYTAAVHYTGSIPQLIAQAFAPLGQAAVSWAERVAMCESGDNPYARNASGASGLFQIMPGTWAGTPYASQSIFNAVANARAAAWIYAHSGPGAWTCG